MRRSRHAIRRGAHAMRRIARNGRTAAAAAALTASIALVSAGPLAAFLRGATGNDGDDGPDLGGSRTELIFFVDNLMGEALLVTVIVAPLVIIWGAATMMFSTQGNGPQIIGATVIAVILVVAARGIAA